MFLQKWYHLKMMLSCWKSLQSISSKGKLQPWNGSTIQAPTDSSSKLRNTKTSYTYPNMRRYRIINKLMIISLSQPKKISIRNSIDNNALPFEMVHSGYLISNSEPTKCLSWGESKHSHMLTWSWGQGMIRERETMQEANGRIRRISLWGSTMYL